MLQDEEDKHALASAVDSRDQAIVTASDIENGSALELIGGGEVRLELEQASGMIGQRDN